MSPRHRVEITHGDRVLFPDDGITKADLAEYHRAVSPYLLPHLVGRPLMLQRFPEGIAAGGFYQKNIGRGVPAWIESVEVGKEGGTVEHPLVDGVDALLALTNLSTVSFHRWLSRVDRLDRPDLLVIDLDPSTADFDEVRVAARRTRDVLDELDLIAFTQVTGSRGMHVVAPLDRSADQATVRTFADDIARLLAARYPDDMSAEHRKASRGERLYVDTARNGYAQTSVAPYSARPRPRAPVATPITWDELDDDALRPDGWTIANVLDRLAATGDPWKGMQRRARAIGPRRKKLDRLLRDAGAEP